MYQFVLSMRSPNPGVSVTVKFRRIPSSTMAAFEQNSARIIATRSEEEKDRKMLKWLMAVFLPSRQTCLSGTYLRRFRRFWSRPNAVRTRKYRGAEQGVDERRFAQPTAPFESTKKGGQMKRDWWWWHRDLPTTMMLSVNPRRRANLRTCSCSWSNPMT